jgi:uncharacterized protein (TIGR01777 family)
MNNNQKHIIIAGGTGLIGSRLREKLNQLGYRVSILTRNSSLSGKPGYIDWNPGQLTVDTAALSDSTAIVNLAGAGVMDHAWTDAYKKKILQSRIDTNLCLRQAMKGMTVKPILISASAIGYYGFGRPDEVFYEDSSAKSGDYLQEVTMKWEDAANRAAEFSRRHATFRIGIVLSADGGALTEMQKGFKLGVGSYFGSGEQVYSWIHIDDLCQMMIVAIQQEHVRGTFNAVAPKPVTAQTFASEIAQLKYGSSRLIPVPAFMAKLALGERHTVLTEGAHVSSNKIEKSGFEFQYRDIQTALSNILESPSGS